MKVKYCSWDVRELAADWGWSELSDSRDRLSPLFRSPEPHSLLLSVNVDSGLVTVYTEDNHSFRNVVFCQTLFQFEEVEKLFQLDHSFSHLISSKAEPKYVSSQESLDRKITKSEELNISPVTECNGSIDVEAFGKILRRWDEEEKNC